MANFYLAAIHGSSLPDTATADVSAATSMISW